MARTLKPSGRGVKPLPQQQIQSSGHVQATAEHVWSLVGNFHGTWHPAIATMAIEHDPQGRVIRAFKVAGETTTYREQLTWYSSSEMSMAYTHIEGIEGAQAYNASLNITDAVTDTGIAECTVAMAAKLDAAEPRATEIATGTQFIFDDAIAAIQKLATSQASSETGTAPAEKPQSCIAVTSTNTQTKTKFIDGTPLIGVSYIESADTTSTTADKTICLFLHGIGGNKSNWYNQLVAVSEHCTAAALDLRGYGDSALGNSQTTVEDYCADILRVADSFNAKKIILCGLSYGAWIATSFAVRYPDRLAGLVLSGGCTGMSEAGVDERKAFLHSRAVPLSEGKTPADFAPDVVPVLAGPDITDAVRQELLQSMQSIPSGTYADALRCFTNPTEVFDFSAITMPVLLMTGDTDKLAPPDEIKQVALRIHKTSPTPDVRYECLSRAGHVCNLETPEAYNSALTELVKRVAL